MNTVNIYVNDKLIIFSEEKDKSLKISADDIQLAVGSTQLADFTESFKQLIKSKSKKLFIFGNIEKNLEKFAKIFIYIEAAGGLICLKEKKPGSDKKFLFIFRKNKWDLPKGKIERGESPEEGGVRECEEECKISELKILKKIPSTYHMYQQKKHWIIKCTHWFLMESTYTGKLVPQKEEGISKVEWVSEKEFSVIKKNTYPSVIDVLQSVSEV